MAAYAKWFFNIHSVQPGTDPPISKFDHYSQIKKSGGKPPALIAPPYPDECRHIWELYARIGRADYAVLKSYCDLTGDELQNWEIEALFGINLAKRAIHD